MHGRHRRKPADLPSLGRGVGISLRVRRFYCRNAKCARRTFAERLPELVAPHARRTRRLAAAQARVGVVLGGEAGSRLLHHLAMPASADTPGSTPKAIQTADRWHLLANMRQAVERWLHGALARLRRLPGGDKLAVPARRVSAACILRRSGS